MIFVTLSLILKNFFWGAGWNAKIQCFSAAKSSTCNCLSFKFKVYTSCCDGRGVNASDQGQGRGGISSSLSGSQL